MGDGGVRGGGWNPVPPSLECCLQPKWVWGLWRRGSRRRHVVLPGGNNLIPNLSTSNLSPPKSPPPPPTVHVMFDLQGDMSGRC